MSLLTTNEALNLFLQLAFDFAVDILANLFNIGHTFLRRMASELFSDFFF